MAAEDLGTLRIGISADTSELDAQLKVAQQKVASFKIPEREIPIRVRISTPTEAAIKAAQGKIDYALTKAQKLGVVLTPGLTVKNANIADFRNEIQRLMTKQEKLAIPISADVDGPVLKAQILQALGVTDIPLTWHWVGEPPPGGGGGSIGIGGGGGGGTPTGGKGGKKGGGGGGGVGAAAVVTPTPEPTKATGPKVAATAPTIGKATPAPTGAARPAGAAFACPICAGTKFPQSYASQADLNRHYGAIHPAASAPTVTKQSQTVAPVTPTAPTGPSAPKAPTIGVATPATPPTGAAPVIGEAKPTGTFTKPTLTPEQVIEQRILDVINKLQRGRLQGFTRLLEMGAIVSPDNQGVVRAKQRSDLAKYLKDKPEALEGINVALSTYQQALAQEEKIGRPAFTGSALSMAGKTTARTPSAMRRIKEMIQRQARERAQEFRKRPDVQAFKQMFAERGFAAFGDFNPETREGESSGIGAGLLTAQGLMATDPAKAREVAVETLTMFASLFPKQFGRLFPNDPGRVKSPLSASKKPRGVRITEPTYTNKAGKEVPNPRYNPALEAVGSAISAIFSDITTKSLPLRDEREKIERQVNRSARSTKAKGIVSPGLIEEQTAREQRSAAATALTKRGLSRAKAIGYGQPGGLIGPAMPVGLGSPIDFSADEAFREKEIARIRKEVHGYDSERFPRKPFSSLELAGPEFGRRYPSEPNIPPVPAATADAEIRARSAARAKLRSPSNPIKILDFGPSSLFPRRAAGGPVLKAGGLMARLAKQGVALPENAVIVGEKGEELFVPKTDGHIIDNEGKNLPEWMRRSKAGQNRGKDLTGRMRARGGAVRGAAGGAFRSFVPGEKEAIGANVLAGATSGSVQRVFVVNWPSGFGSARSAPTEGRAAGTFTLDDLGRMFGGTSTGGGTKRARKPKAGPIPGEEEGEEDTFRLRKVSPLERIKAETAIEDEFLALKFGIAEVGAARSAQMSMLAQRSMPMAVGEAVSTSLGKRSEAVERSRKAAAIQEQAGSRASLWQREARKFQEAERALNSAIEEGADPKTVAKFRMELEEQGEVVRYAADETRKLTKEAAEFTETITSGSGILRNWAANFGGIIGGTLIFGGVLTAVQAGLSGIGTLLTPVIDRMTGFRSITAETTSALADQVRQSGGAVQATTSLAYAATGLSDVNAESIGPMIERRAQTEAGNKAIQAQIDLLHVAQQLQQQAGGTGQFDRGLVATTGGFLGTDLFGQASTAEMMVKELKTIPGAAQRAAAPPPPIETGLPPGMFNTNPLTFPQLPQPSVEKATADWEESIRNGQKTLDLFNNQAVKGGESLLKLTYATQEQADASANIAATSPLLKDFAKQLSESGIQLQGAKTPEDFLRFLQAQNITATRPDPQLLIKSMMERIVPNQLAAFQAEAQYQTRTAIPAQQALEFLNAPPMPYGAGIVQIGQGTNGALPTGPAPITGLGPNASAVDPTATSSFNEYRSVAQSALDAVIAKAREGRQALLGMGIPPQLITELETLGNAAQGIELGLANRQAAVAAAQYNHQLFILNRNLADAMALAGMQVGAAGRLGKLQRENFELSKKQNALQIQAQELSLALSQRQINFQRAIAGFVSPGETAEERAARIEQAKIEADYAQKQLDIQKQLLGLGKKQFNLGVQIFDATAQRQVQDLQYALADLKQARALQLDTTAAQQALVAIRARQAQINAEVGVGIEKATKTAALRISTALDLANKSGETFGNILITVGTAFNRAIQIAFSTLTGGGGGGGGGGKQNMLLASGIVGDTLGPTNITVGEAGKEKVAVVKNPRNVSLRSLSGMAPSDAGGGVTIIVDVHDNAIKDEGSIDALVAKISRAVESSINRKTSLLGLRTT